MEASYPTPHSIFICLPEPSDDHHSHTNYPSGLLLQLPSLRVSGPVPDSCWHCGLFILQVIHIKIALVYCLSYTYTSKRDYSQGKSFSPYITGFRVYIRFRRFWEDTPSGLLMHSHPCIFTKCVIFVLFRSTLFEVGLCRQNQFLYVALHFCFSFISFFRRSKLRDARVQPEPEYPSEEELLVLSSRKSTLARPSSAPSYASRKVGLDFILQE